MARGRRTLLIAAGPSIGIHLAIALLIVLLPRILSKDDRRVEQGTIELVMVEHKGAEPGAAGDRKPDQTPAPDPPKPDVPKTETPGQSPPAPPIDRAREEAVPRPAEPTQPSAIRTDVPAIAEQQRQTAPSATQAAPIFNFREAESEYDATVLGNGVIPATLDSKFRNRPPIYAFEAAARGEHGRVVLVAHVGPNGLVRGIDVVEGTGFPGLDRAAVAAVEKWRFRPAMKEGQGVGFEFRCEFLFSSG